MSIYIHVTGGKDPAKCPSSVDGECPDCKSMVEQEYGCCCYGVGAFQRCMKCGKVYDFEGDTED